jgi:hypothetical protein
MGKSILKRKRRMERGQATESVASLVCQLKKLNFKLEMTLHSVAEKQGPLYKVI